MNACLAMKSWRRRLLVRSCSVWLRTASLRTQWRPPLHPKSRSEEERVSLATTAFASPFIDAPRDQPNHEDGRNRLANEVCKSSPSFFIRIDDDTNQHGQHNCDCQNHCKRAHPSRPFRPHPISPIYNLCSLWRFWFGGAFGDPII